MIINLTNHMQSFKFYYHVCQYYKKKKKTNQQFILEMKEYVFHPASHWNTIAGVL